MAGTHRYANGDGSGDVAHETGTMFALVHRALVTRRHSVVQLHGFTTDADPADPADDDDSDAEADSDEAADGREDIVLSAGEPDPEIALEPVTEALRAAGFGVCQYDGGECAGLGGTQNVLGVSSREVGARFLHVELSRQVRDDPARRASAAQVVADALAGRRAGS